MLHCVDIVIQAKFWCTSRRARKVVVSLIVVTLITQVVAEVCWYMAGFYVLDYINTAVFRAIIPVAVLVINVVVVFKVRRAATNAAANLGVQPHHHQSTSSSSAVPTVMLVATSLIYVLFYSTVAILHLTHVWLSRAGVSHEMLYILLKPYVVAEGLSHLVFAYNFYVYLITGKTFRSELHKLFCCCSSSSNCECQL